MREKAARLWRTLIIVIIMFVKIDHLEAKDMNYIAQTKKGHQFSDFYLKPRPPGPLYRRGGESSTKFLE